MKQRMLSFLLALVMVLGCAPAWAEDEMTFTTSFSIPLGASSVLIAVSVALETVRQLESQLVMRNYKGFLG